MVQDVTTLLQQRMTTRQVLACCTYTRDLSGLVSETYIVHSLLREPIKTAPALRLKLWLVNTRS
jgi:hypothetical protein